MYKIAHFILFMALALLSASCSRSGKEAEGKHASDRVEITRKARYFSSLTVDAPCTVYFSQEAKPSLRIVGRKSDVSRIVTVHSGNKLLVKTKFFDSSKLGGQDIDGVKIYVSSPDLTVANMKGVGKLVVKGDVDTDTMRVTLGGVGSVSFDNLVCDHLSVVLRGSGNVAMANVRSVSVRSMLQGLGSIDMHLHGVETTNISLVGLGSVNADFADCGVVYSSLVGLGSIDLAGNVAKLVKDKKGSGDISTQGLTVKAVR